uniref:hypothetical protein n=1 Tax=Nesterenkonia alba TaxID=515814 RepID=UPI0003B58E09
AIPTTYHFDYGDGTTATTHTPGGDYSDHAASLPPGENPMDIPTPTSHIYSQTGVYTVSLEVTFTGEYRINHGPWTPIPGVATVEATPGQADIWRRRHALVSGPCTNTTPEAFGCNGPVTLTEDDQPPRIWAHLYDEHNNYIGP